MQESSWLLFPPVFILTLKSDKERVDHVTNTLIPSLKALGFLNIEIFPAVEGKVKDDLEKAWKHNNLELDKKYGLSAKRGQLACYCSHYKIWKKAVNMSEHNQFIVLEDDAIVNCGNEYSSSLNAEIIDYNADFTFLYTPKNQLQNNVNVQIIGKNLINRSYYQWCTVAYQVNRQGLEKLIKTCRIADDNIDNKIRILIEKNEITGASCKVCPYLTIGQLGDTFESEKFESNIWNSERIYNVSSFNK